MFNCVKKYFLYYPELIAGINGNSLNNYSIKTEKIEIEMIRGGGP